MPEKPSSLFLTTRWTLVGEAAQTGEEESKTALGSLFEIYWKPLYRYVRRTGTTEHDAEDLVQGFFAHLLEGNGLRLADRDRGRFRAFLLGALKNYMANEWRKRHRQKRGSFSPHLSLDWCDAETGLSLDLEDPRSPDRWFDKEWAMALLDKVLDGLELEESDFAKWKPFLGLNRERIPYAETAREFGITEGAARVAVHRLRKRYRQRLRDEVAGTLGDPSLVDEEMACLFAALSGDSS